MMGSKMHVVVALIVLYEVRVLEVDIDTQQASKSSGRSEIKREGKRINGGDRTLDLKRVKLTS